MYLALNIGLINAIFIISGDLPSDKDLFIIFASGDDRGCFRSFNNFGEIEALSGFDI